jgi:hypothetical protein
MRDWRRKAEWKVPEPSPTGSPAWSPAGPGSCWSDSRESAVGVREGRRSEEGVVTRMDPIQRKERKRKRKEMSNGLMEERKRSK